MTVDAIATPSRSIALKDVGKIHTMESPYVSMRIALDRS
jgi:hypothetical protein